MTRWKVHPKGGLPAVEWDKWDLLEQLGLGDAELAVLLVMPVGSKFTDTDGDAWERVA